ncbi:MAG: HAD-IB family hydrolase [Solirubrobacteraceae bacterium]
MVEKRTLYLFDFDGTITKKDSLFHFLKFYANPVQYFLGLIIFSPLFLLAKSNVLNKSKIKEMFISFFLKAEPQIKIEEIANDYANEVEKIFRPKATEMLLEIKKDPFSDCYIVSASLDSWLKPIAKKNGVNLICTNALYQNGFYTGKFSSINCNFKEKKNRILKEINIKKYNKIISFGDSKGDLEMFSISDEIHFKPFR